MKRVLGILALGASSLCADTLVFTLGSPGTGSFSGGGGAGTLTGSAHNINLNATTLLNSGNYNNPTWSGDVSFTGTGGTYTSLGGPVGQWAFTGGSITLSGIFTNAGIIANTVLMNITFGPWSMVGVNGGGISLGVAPALTISATNTPAPDGFDFLAYFGLYPGAISGMLTSLGFGPTTAFNTSTGAFSNQAFSSGVFEATLSAVPEPSTALFLSSGLALLLFSAIARKRLGRSA